MYSGKSGLDHLGLGSVSRNEILPALSPGINVLTDHPRYHSFYTFLLHEFWERERPRSRRAWSTFYRPREFILSLATHLCDRPEHGDMPGAVGSQRTEGLARKQLPLYDTSFNYIKHDLGGYGYYYRSVIAELGLIYPGGPGFPYPVDIPSERGKEVANAFRQAIANTEYYRAYFSQDIVEIPIEAVREYARVACLCQLKRPDSADRQLLLETFLEGGNQRDAKSRLLTFRFLLDLIAQTDGHPLEEDVYRQLIYFGGTSSGATYNARQELEGIARRWRLYQLREYYAFALDALWCYLCDWGLRQGGETRPVALNELFAHIQEALEFDHLDAALQLGATGPRATSPWRDLLVWVEDVNAQGNSGPDGGWSVDVPLNEHRLYSLIKSNRDSPVAVPSAVALLAALAVQFGSSEYRFRAEWELSRMGAAGRLSVDGFLSALRRRTDASIEDVVEWLYRDYVILQHELVALSKMPDNTFRFRREGDRLRFFQFYNPLEFNSSRFPALTTTLAELGFCDDVRNPAHPLTSDGEGLLERGTLK